METKDLYKVLGVGKGASQEEVRRAYRKLAREHHPDANRDDPKAEERFKEVQHAYEVLSNPEKRREYDEGPRAYFGGASRGGAEGRSDANLSDLSDLFGSFGDIFGGAGRERTNKSVTVKIPAGARDGMKIRVPGRGSAGKKGGPPGDLYVLTRVAGHPVF